jgi:tetratricopeptide (TPR) repeat protein
MNLSIRTLAILFGLTFSLYSFASYSPKTRNFPQDDLPKYGKDSVKCVQDLSLYRESYKQWKQSRYKSPAVNHAYRFWKKTLAECPKASENIYVDGAKMIDHFIRINKDAKRKEGLIDSLMLVYDMRIEYFPNYWRPPHPSQIGTLLGRKGVDLYQNRPSAYKEAYEILKKSIDLDKDSSSGIVYVYYFRAITKMAKKGEIDTAAVVEAYDMISDYIDINIAKYAEKGDTKEVEEYNNIMGNIENTFEPFAQCNDLVRIYHQKFDQDSDNPALLKKIVKLLDKKKCIDDPLYFDVTVKLYDLEPTPESAYLIGKMLLSQKRFGEAIKYMEDATQMKDTTKVDDAYIFLAQAYKAINEFPKARQMALKAAELNPGWGDPYLFIGDLYALSAKDCGDNDLTKKVAYWAAVDKYYKAKQVEPDLAEVANKRINTYKVYFPPTEVIFFHNLNEGESYTVGCWINEVTTVRAAK